MVAFVQPLLEEFFKDDYGVVAVEMMKSAWTNFGLLDLKDKAFDKDLNDWFYHMENKHTPGVFLIATKGGDSTTTKAEAGGTADFRPTSCHRFGRERCPGHSGPQLVQRGDGFQRS